MQELIILKTPCSFYLDFAKYKIDRYSDSGELRFSGSLHLHLLSGEYIHYSPSLMSGEYILYLPHSFLK
jgi:hypothetical protein